MQKTFISLLTKNLSSTAYQHKQNKQIKNQNLTNKFYINDKLLHKIFSEKQNE